MTRNKVYRFDLIQNGIVVASVESASKAGAAREIGHYAVMYAQDGPVEIVERMP